MMTMAQALEQWTSDTLKKYLDLLSGHKKPTRKAERIDAICQQFLHKDSLQTIWQGLDPIAKRAVSTAYHNDGLFDTSAFVAQYSELPPRPEKDRWYSYYKEPILFDLFVINGTIPSDLMPLLADLVLPVERFQLEGVERVPATITHWHTTCDIIQAETEMVGQTDVLTYLQLVEQGALQWSAKNKELTAASVRKLYVSLMAGDFHPEPEKLTGRYVVRPFGLDTFARNAGLVTSTGKLTSTGRNYLQTRDPNLIGDAFEKWVEKGKFDELTRITHLNGLNARGTRLTSPASRREKVIEALSWCPTGTWIYFKDFYRAVLIWQFDFDVETTDWSNLYAGYYKEYGYMNSSDYWLIVKGLYINAIIMEYLATIGAVDIAYVSEDISFIETQADYVDEAYSLHDGLLYFRINSWGAFLLGQAAEYVPTQPRKKALFTIDEQLQVHLLADLLPNEQLQLEAVAKLVEGGVYQLDAVMLLTAVESGQKFEFLAQFLQVNHQGELPPHVAGWLAQLQQNLGAFREGETAVIIELKSADARSLAQQDATLAKLCTVLNDTAVVVLTKNMKKFKNRLKEIGYLLSSS